MDSAVGLELVLVVELGPELEPVSLEPPLPELELVLESGPVLELVSGPVR